MIKVTNNTTSDDLMESMKRQYAALTIADDFVFCKAMLNPEVCREVLEAILGLEIKHIEYAGHQEQLDVTPTAKSVRLDVIVQDEKNTVYNVEMQKVNTHELPHRSRYYHAMLALDQVQKGESYKSLKNTFVIFICNFDLFGQGRRVYYFENTCRDVDGLKLGDGASTIFLAANAPGHPNDDGRLVEFLDYVSKGAVTGDLSAKLHAEVASVLDSEKWRAEYMYLQVRDQLNYERGQRIGHEAGVEEGFSIGHASGLAEGIEQGRETGLAEGIRQGRETGLAEGIQQGRETGLAEGIQQGRETGLAEGEGKFAQLVSELIQRSRSCDVERAASDAAFRQDLYREFGIE